MKQHYDDYYPTTDLALTATLSIFFSLEFVERIDTHKVQFYFKRSAELDRVVTDYWNGKLLIDPQEFFNKLKIIKTRIYDTASV